MRKTSYANRFFYGVISCVMLLLLCDCSGGGGGGSGGGNGGGSSPPLVYNGLTTPAVIDSGNAMDFLTIIIGDALAPPDIDVNAGTAQGQQEISDNPSSNSTKMLEKATPLNGTLPGMVSGEMTYSGAVKDDGTGEIKFTFTDFDDGDGFTYDGMMILTLLSFDAVNMEVTHALLKMWPLSIRTDQEAYKLAGTTEIKLDIAQRAITMIFNLDGRDEMFGYAFRAENVVFATTSDDFYAPAYRTETVTGRIYVETEGYVDISVQSPLEYHYPGKFNVDVPDAGGPMVFTGAKQTGISLTPLSIGQVKVAVDTDEPPNFHTATTYLWSELVGIVYAWENTYGSETNFDVAHSVQQTSDGGYVAAGWTNTNSPKRLDMMLVKTDAGGGLEWSRTFGGEADDEAWSVHQTVDGGYVIAGFSAGDMSAQSTIYKTDPAGEVEWVQTLMKELENRAFAIQQTRDGGYILTGSIASFSPATGVVGYGQEDLYVVKLDSTGQMMWERRFGGPAADMGRAVIESIDGSFVVTGETGSFDIQQTPDVYLIRIGSNGNLLWEKNFGDDLSQNGNDIIENAEGDLIIAGESATLSSGVVHVLYKVDASGNLTWSSTFGSSNGISSITMADDGACVVAGSGIFDAELYKIGPAGDLIWQRVFNWSPYMTQCTAYEVESTSDGGFILGGSAWPNSGKDFYLIKTDAEGNLYR